MYSLRSIIETALADYLTAAGVVQAVGADGGLPSLYKGLNADTGEWPRCVVQVQRVTQEMAGTGSWRAYIRVAVESQGDKDDSDTSFDPVTEHASDTEAIFDALMDTDLVTGLTGTSLAVAGNYILNVTFDYNTTDRIFSDSMSFEIICCPLT